MPWTVRSCINDLSFDLKTLDTKSGRSDACSPGCKLSLISCHFGFTVNVMNRSGEPFLQRLTLHPRIALSCSAENLQKMTAESQELQRFVPHFQCDRQVLDKVRLVIAADVDE